MTLLSNIISSGFVNALGQTILHSLWQGLVIGFFAWILMRVYGKENLKFKFWIGTSSIVSILILFLLTFTILYSSGIQTVADEVIVSNKPGILNLIINSGSVSSTFATSSAMAAITPYLTVFWIIGVLFFALKLTGGVLLINQMKKSFRVVRNERLLTILKETRIKIGVSKQIILAESSRINIPALLGHFKPVLLFPIGTLASLPLDQVEAIMAHELAHIKRHDYLLGIIFSLVEIILFYHPIVWWLSSTLKKDREIICDDMALEIVNKLSYAKALAKIGELCQSSQLMPAFSGNKHLLLDRIQRINNFKKMKTKKNITHVLTTLTVMAGFIILFSSAIHPNFPVIEAQNSTGYIADADTVIHAQIKHKGANHQVIMKWNADKVLLLEIDGKKIKSTNFGQYDAIIKKAKKMAKDDGDKNITTLDIIGSADREIEGIEIEEVVEGQLIEIVDGELVEVVKGELVEVVEGKLLEVEDLIEIEELKEIKELMEIEDLREIEEIVELEIIETEIEEIRKIVELNIIEEEDEEESTELDDYILVDKLVAPKGHLLKFLDSISKKYSDDKLMFIMTDDPKKTKDSKQEVKVLKLRKK